MTCLEKLKRIKRVLCLTVLVGKQIWKYREQWNSCIVEITDEKWKQDKLTICLLHNGANVIGWYTDECGNAKDTEL